MGDIMVSVFGALGDYYFGFAWFFPRSRMHDYTVYLYPLTQHTSTNKITTLGRRL